MGAATKILEEFKNEIDKKTFDNFLLMFNKKDIVTIPLIQRKCKCGYNSAYRVLNYLIEMNMVEKYMNVYKRI